MWFYYYFFPNVLKVISTKKSITFLAIILSSALSTFWVEVKCRMFKKKVGKEKQYWFQCTIVLLRKCWQISWIQKTVSIGKYQNSHGIWIWIFHQILAWGDAILHNKKSMTKIHSTLSKQFWGSPPFKFWWIFYLSENQDLFAKWNCYFPNWEQLFDFSFVLALILWIKKHQKRWIDCLA